jgi:hypothetical protein
MSQVSVYNNVVQDMLDLIEESEIVFDDIEYSFLTEDDNIDDAIEETVFCYLKEGRVDFNISIEENEHWNEGTNYDIDNMYDVTVMVEFAVNEFGKDSEVQFLMPMDNYVVYINDFNNNSDLIQQIKDRVDKIKYIHNAKMIDHKKNQLKDL